jgi:hypothetical protein
MNILCSVLYKIQRKQITSKWLEYHNALVKFLFFFNFNDSRTKLSLNLAGRYILRLEENINVFYSKTFLAFRAYKYTHPVHYKSLSLK